MNSLRAERSVAQSKRENLEIYTLVAIRPSTAGLDMADEHRLLDLPLRTGTL